MKCLACGNDCTLVYRGTDPSDPYRPTREWVCDACGWEEDEGMPQMDDEEFKRRVKEYLKENLAIQVNIRPGSSYSRQYQTVEVTITLDGEEIASSQDTVEEFS